MSRYARRRLPPTTVHRVLSSPRRATALRLLRREGAMRVSELADAVAAVEADGTPPRALRDSVYNSLRQTHLPRLADLGLVACEDDLVRPLAATRHVARYATPVALFGVSWAELYRALGIVGLCLVVATLAGVPPVAAVDPLVWASATLAAFAVTSGCQLWADRRVAVREPPGRR